MSSRFVRVMLKHLKCESDRAVVQRLRGQSSNCQLPDEMKQRAIALFGGHKQARQWQD